MITVQTNTERLREGWVAGGDFRPLHPMSDPGFPTLVQDVLPTPAQWELIRELQSKVFESLAGGLRILGFYPIFDEPLHLAGSDLDFVVYPLQKDPLWQKLGSRCPIPARELKRLRELQRCGLRLPAIYIAEEVPKGASHRLKTLILDEVTVPLPRETLSLAESIDSVVVGVTSGLQSAAVGAFAAIFSLGALFLTVGVVLAASTTSCPIILGAFTRSGKREVGELACYCMLAAWEW